MEHFHTLSGAITPQTCPSVRFVMTRTPCASDGTHSTCCSIQGGFHISGYNTTYGLDELWMTATWFRALTGVMEYRPSCGASWTAPEHVTVTEDMVFRAYPWEESGQMVARASPTAMVMADVHNSGRVVYGRIVVDGHEFVANFLLAADEFVDHCASLRSSYPQASPYIPSVESVRAEMKKLEEARLESMLYFGL